MPRLGTLLLLAVLLATPLLAEEPATPAPERPVLVFVFNIGKVEVELWPDIAPNTVANFLSYVDEGYYDGTIIHRVARNPAIVQGGGYDRDLERKPTRAAIKLEAKASNEAYTIAMARKRDPHSATTQFYFNLKNNSFLDPNPRGGYAVFGKVVSGRGVVDVIYRSSTRPRGNFRTMPVNEIVLEKVVRKGAAPAAPAPEGEAGQ